jgi:hypothetical protein
MMASTAAVAACSFSPVLLLTNCTNSFLSILSVPTTRSLANQGKFAMNYYFSFFAGLSPSFIASCSLMYFPCLVLPYHLEPSL